MEPIPDQLQGLRGQLRLYVRMLWGDAPELHALPPGDGNSRAHLAGLVWHLPAVPQAASSECARETYLAMAAHAAAHRRHGGTPFARGTLKPVQQVLLALLEDARVEWLAMRELPGLRTVWGRFHAVDAAATPTLENLLLRLARSLFDPAYLDPHPWVGKGRRLFFAGRDADGHPVAPDAGALRDIASRLGNDFGQMRLPFNARQYRVEPAYRDDNVHLWATPPEETTALPLHLHARATQGDADDDPDDMEMAGGSGASDSRRSETDHPGALQTPDNEATDGDAADAESVVRLREWDHLIRRYRADWCTVRVTPARPVAAGAASNRRQDTFASPRDRRLARQLIAMSVRLPPAVRAMDGEIFDIDALVEARVARRLRLSVDSRVYRVPPRRRDPGTLVVLLDTSASTGCAIPAAGEREPEGTTVLDRTRSLGWFLADAAQRAGHRCALYSFASNTRTHVRLRSIKDFVERADSPEVPNRLLSLEPEWSTRLGAALRYASGRLRRAAGTGPRRVLMITDGDPHDVDIHDKRYLREDLRAALREAALMGIEVTIVDPACGIAREASPISS